MSLRLTLQKSWREPNILTYLLVPFSWLYRLLFWLNKCLYQYGLKSVYRAPVPVIVVGNISVGGTGKSPLIIYLAEQLQQQGYSPGIISRGYQSQADTYPFEVTASTPVKQSGDEALMIHRRTGLPTVIGANRKEDIELLLSKHKVDVILSDDGLQHHALARDIEVCIVQPEQAKSNSNLLPAGPFRESHARLKSVDFLVQQGCQITQPNPRQFVMQLVADKPLPLLEDNKNSFDSTNKVHAVAGIGTPSRFFESCRQLGWDIIEHEFADHHRFVAEDLEFGDQLPIVMTEKDQVKCLDFANNQHWYLPVDVKIEGNLIDQICMKLNQKTIGVENYEH